MGFLNAWDTPQLNFYKPVMKKLSSNHLWKHRERYEQFGITFFQNFIAVLGWYSDIIMEKSKPKGEVCLR